MSTKKIGYWESQTIAKNVAEKAFEHLRQPLQAEVDKEAKQAYDKVLTALGLSFDNIKSAAAAEVVEMNKLVRIRIKDATDPEDDILITTLSSDKDEYVTRTMLIPDCFSEELFVAWCKLKPTADAQDGLELRVKNDIGGKSVSSVLKKWPEIRGFVEDVMGKQGDTDLVVPFSDLIKKYLGPLMIAGPV